jgi:alpha,alpha-trehalose phosphorylase
VVLADRPHDPVTSTRLVSLVQRSVAAIDYQVEAVDRPVRLVIQSELATNEPLPPASGDPRVSAMLEAPLRSERHTCDGVRAELVYRTEHSGMLIGAAMDPLVDGPPCTQVLAESFADLGRVTVTVSLEPGQRLRLVKFVTGLHDCGGSNGQ